MKPIDLYGAIEKRFDLTDIDEETGEPFDYFPREALGVLGMHLQGLQEDMQNDYALEVERDGEGIDPRYLQRALSWVIAVCTNSEV